MGFAVLQGLEFIACDPYVDPATAAELGVKLVDMDTLFTSSDFLSVNCPLNDETEGIVSAERLAQMKPTAFLVSMTTSCQRALPRLGRSKHGRVQASFLSWLRSSHDSAADQHLPRPDR